MAKLFSFGGPKCELAIYLHDDGSRLKKEMQVVGKPIKVLLPIYEGTEPVSGTVEVARTQGGKRIEHNGIRIQLIGQIEFLNGQGNAYEFSSLVKELAAPGMILEASKRFTFEFSSVEKPFESYAGANVRLRYYLRATVTKGRGFGGDQTDETEILVQNRQLENGEIITPNTPYQLQQQIVASESKPIRMEVGIEDCLHIEFEYSKNRYHLQDVVLGKVYFLLVRIRIKFMELALIRREASGSGPTTSNQSDTITKYEVMDGVPVKGECVPIRMFLKPLHRLTPTYDGVANRFSVRYYLNLVLVDEEDRRYFKQHEIKLWRKDVV